MKRVHVAAAVIRGADGRVLIAKRPQDKHQGGLWEFPGGKVEEGEAVERALARELEQLLMLKLASDGGQPLAPLLEKARIWSSRQPLYQQALQRLNSSQLQQLIAVTVLLDRAVRCFETEEAWLLLQSVSLGFRHEAALTLVQS